MTIEAELVALDISTREAQWLRELLSKNFMLEKLIPAILIHCYNHATIAKLHSKNKVIKSLRHIELRYKIFEKVDNNRCCNSEICEVCKQSS